LVIFRVYVYLPEGTGKNGAIPFAALRATQRSGRRHKWIACEGWEGGVHQENEW
jgi:hypothetical protein